MTPQELKASILQLAIQGKLVEQRAKEGTASAYKQQLISEREKLITAKLIKKEREVLEQDEPPFEIPDTWVWIRVGDCISNKAGLAYNKGDLDIKSESMIHVLRGGNIGDMTYSLKPDDVLIASQFVPSELLLKQNTLITPAVTSLEHVGKVGRIDKDLDDAVVGGFVLILTPHINNDTFAQYLLYTFSSKYFRDRCRGIVNKSGQAFYNLSREKLMNLYIPLPPLAEQKRIVAKIEELLPYIDRYEQAWSRLEEFNRQFPVDMQKSILQMAIQGKLVEQRPEEGTGEELYQQIQQEKQRLIKAGTIKKEKPLPEITEDEIPFDIPKGWKWVRTGEIFDVGTGMTPLKGEPRFYQGGTIPWVTSSLTSQRYIECAETNVTKYALENTSLVVYPAHTLIVAMYGQGKTRGQVAELLLAATINQACAALGNILYSPELVSYVYYCYLFNYEVLRKKAEGTSQPNLNLSKIKETIIPLPPLAEQKRIVAKLEEILPLCERLK